MAASRLKINSVYSSKPAPKLAHNQAGFRIPQVDRHKAQLYDAAYVHGLNVSPVQDKPRQNPECFKPFKPHDMQNKTKQKKSQRKAGQRNGGTV
ncbi:hypothetical protein VTN49DRAFT_2315 [Thermomyces lanuginosus]|uniref:uncharacterized protein n=1 Tax=Thermomyces lanuginosus TaxID=5541 RepID=UPI003743D2CB